MLVMSTFAGRNVLRRRLSSCSSACCCLSVSLSVCLPLCLSVCLSVTVQLFVVRQRVKPIADEILSRRDWVDFVAQSERAGGQQDQEGQVRQRMCDELRRRTSQRISDLST